MAAGRTSTVVWYWDITPKITFCLSNGYIRTKTEKGIEPYTSDLSSIIVERVNVNGYGDWQYRRLLFYSLASKERNNIHDSIVAILYLFLCLRVQKNYFS